MLDPGAKTQIFSGTDILLSSKTRELTVILTGHRAARWLQAVTNFDKDQHRDFAASGSTHTTALTFSKRKLSVLKQYGRRTPPSHTLPSPPLGVIAGM